MNSVKFCHRHHHHHRVARQSVSIAVSTSCRHFERSCARIHAVLRPRLWGWRSSSIVRSHVRLGRPARRRQSTGGRLMAVRRMREWSYDGSALARCPNRRSRLFAITEVTGGWPTPRSRFFVWHFQLMPRVQKYRNFRYNGIKFYIYHLAEFSFIRLFILASSCWLFDDAVLVLRQQIPEC